MIKIKKGIGMEYKLIAMDFDGTLLTDDKNVSPKTEEILRKLKKEGYKIVGATARPLDSSKDVVPIDIFTHLIINNGVTIYNVDKQEEEWMGYITPQEASEIIKEVETVSTQIDLISGTKYYVYKHKKNSPLSFIIDIDKVEDVKEKIARMNIFLQEGEDANTHYQWITQKFPNINCFVMQDSGSEKQWLIINPKNINKAHTLEKLGEELGIDCQEMIFFGDGLNDLEVMESVGLSVAMGNALEEVKEKASIITDSNNEDGIAKFLTKKLKGLVDYEKKK